MNVRAEHGLRHIDIKVQQNIIFTTLEELVRLNIQYNEQASIRAAKYTGTALPIQADLGSYIHTCGDLHFLLHILAFQTSPTTSLARRGNHFAATTTSRASRRLYHLA